MMKRKLLYLILILLVISLVGCKQNIVMDETTGIDMSDEATQEPVDEAQEEIQEVEELSASGMYVGLMDNNSFEVVIDDFPMAFRHVNCISYIGKAGISDGDLVELSYFINEDGQNMVNSIVRIEKTLTIYDLFPLMEGAI